MGKTSPAGAKPRARPIPQPFDPEAVRATLGDLPAGIAHVVLPWPPSQLNPNRKMHGAAKAPFVKSYRKTCWELALEAFGANAGKRMFPGDDEIAVRLDFFPPTAQSRDDDNCEAAFKAGRDGVAQALGLDDRRFAVTRRLRSEVRGCVLLTFTGGQP